MFRIHVPAAGRWPAGVALVVIAGWLFVGAPAKGQAAPPQQAQAAKNPYVLGTDGAVLLNFVKADKTADFEMIMAKLKEALNKSDKPERKQQAAGWKVFKAGEQGAGGTAIYVTVIDPVVKGADYTVSTILAEGFSPAETNDLYKKYADVFGTPAGNLLNLTTLMHMK
jgi:hypothetical protein